MRDDECVFWFVYQGLGPEQESIQTWTLPLSLASGKKKEEKKGGGGLSVLEKSHVVGESGQLLLVWNQWDGGRICGWGRDRGGKVQSEGDSSVNRSRHVRRVNGVWSKRVAVGMCAPDDWRRRAMIAHTPQPPRPFAQIRRFILQDKWLAELDDV